MGKNGPAWRAQGSGGLAPGIHKGAPGSGGLTPSDAPTHPALRRMDRCLARVGGCVIVCVSVRATVTAPGPGSWLPSVRHPFSAVADPG